MTEAPLPTPSIARQFGAVLIWLGLWALLIATGALAAGEAGTDAWVFALVVPQFVLGVVARRAWVSLLPLGTGIYWTVWAESHPSSALSEVSGVPLLAGLLAVIPVLLGVLSAHLWERNHGTQPD